ncbi:hypothetical protein DICSQDRAFT_182991 [Dichomitus squalens LYAD-421 SS1]|uniref:F-box domain-containing protein n=1 Tax=Dichomitus squalens (strain LYAD-421) TaxID=732165 RepID=R7SS12_DICSQ|nr:uncharacterized protein DICSQDRAFT_182991 [Dichomitus squalens LYAD-421 SS1]EJF57747.1 hypothetical protein DICSQDRAFT_182991 [Dichomitus squalens LYAD-421 SS1]
MPDIQRIPYDIWHLIFEHVCTDGGYSGCALARTSKAFRALSASTRFHSLTLASVTGVKNFLVCLERIRHFERARCSSAASEQATTDAGSPNPIHNLLLSFLPDGCDAPQRAFRKWTDYARDERALVHQLANDHKAWAVQKAHWNREFVLHVSRLLQLAAPTLRSLAIFQCGEIRLPLVHYHHHFPLLRELTLLADDRMFVRVPGGGALINGQNDPSDFDYYHVPTDPPADPPFPALTHMHVVFAGPKLHPWDKTLPLWVGIAPSVTHLRISQGNTRVPSLLGELLGVPPLPKTTEDGEQELAEGPSRDREPSYPSLQTIIVQMSSARKTNAAEDPALRELQRVADVLAVEEVHAPRVAILRSRSYMPGYWESRLKWEWQIRMVGGGGCWMEDEEHECVWKDFHDEDSQKKGKKGKTKVSIRERLEGSSDSSGVEGERQGKKWWKVLANGMPKLNRKRSIPSSYPMDCFPIDIWNEVFRYACTDGGHTGAALALTSLCFRATSAPFRFHSVKLSSLAQIANLLLCHERIHSRSSSRLRPGDTSRSHTQHSRAALDASHLLLAFLPGECDAPERRWRAWSEYSRGKRKLQNELYQDEQAWENSKAAWDRQFEYLVPRLFQLVGPTLETLTILMHSDIVLPYVGGHFPKLRELSLLADDRLFVRPEPQWTTAVGTFDHEELARFWNHAIHSPPFPTLTHLHIVYEGPKQIPWERTLPLWGKLAPEVTHIRVSQASKLMPEVLEGIATKSFAQVQAKAEATATGSPDHRKRVSFPKLRRAIVQPFVLEPMYEELCYQILEKTGLRDEGYSIEYKGSA